MQLAPEVQPSLTATNEKAIRTNEARHLTEITATAIPRSIATRYVLSTEQRLQVPYGSGTFSVVVEQATFIILQDVRIKLHSEAQRTQTKEMNIP